jgi:rhamnosyltransferase
LQTSEAGAIVVFFHPEPRAVEGVNRLADWVRVVVVDNTPGSEHPHDAALASSVEVVRNGTNLGVATAINQGVACLMRMGIRFGLLFDQDSEPTKEHVQKLPEVLSALADSGRRVAAVGPAYYDERLGGVARFVRFGMFRLKRIEPVGDEPVDVDFLISSGSCLNLEYWDEIGPMEDDLFIDFVDLEWCVRAKNRGFSILGVPSVTMRHSLGDEPLHVFGRPFALHSPIRHYYLFRNATALMCRRYMPTAWKTSELVKFPVRLWLYGVMADQRLEHLGMCASGVWDGLRKRLGARELRH